MEGERFYRYCWRRRGSDVVAICEQLCHLPTIMGRGECLFQAVYIYLVCMYKQPFILLMMFSSEKRKGATKS